MVAFVYVARCLRAFFLSGTCAPQISKEPRSDLGGRLED